MEKRSIRLQEIMAAVFSAFFHSVSFRRWLLWPSSFFHLAGLWARLLFFLPGLTRFFCQLYFNALTRESIILSVQINCCITQLPPRPPLSTTKKNEVIAKYNRLQALTLLAFRAINTLPQGEEEEAQTMKKTQRYERQLGEAR